MSRLGPVIASGVLAGAGLIVAAAPQAAAASPDSFFVCVQDQCHNPPQFGFARGDITWHNRTATITGRVVYGADTGGGYTTVIFEAFDANNVKRDSDTRTVNGGDPDGRRDFEFGIGDTNLVGGITRIKTTVCDYYPSGARLCSSSEHDEKNS